MTAERTTLLRRLEELLSFRFHDIHLLDNALVHRSFVNENPRVGLQHNERLEFLGDAVVQLCVSLLLMDRFAHFTEGQLSKFRASLVSEQSLSELSKRFSVGEYLLLGRGEETSHGRMKSSILADAFEAIVGAAFLDGGFEKTDKLIRRIFEPLIEGESGTTSFRDYKTALQESSLRKYGEIPHYTLIGEQGPDHDRIFEMKLTISELIQVTGTGRNKKEAEQHAAKKALEILRGADAGDGEK